MSSTFSLVFSSLYEFSCLFHSSTLAVDSCKAEVNRALLFFKVASSTSHFFAFEELKKRRRTSFRRDFKSRIVSFLTEQIGSFSWPCFFALPQLKEPNTLNMR